MNSCCAAIPSKRGRGGDRGGWRALCGRRGAGPGEPVPLLLSGSDADAAATALAGLGFANLRVVGGDVGRASAIKMIRSVMVKGMEALTAECVLAAARAGVLDEVLASLDASEKNESWADAPTITWTA
jgi:3-hydroxyisobutyrate dehydrogenase-like beta-hydroxyacid dehydrogenase